MTPVPAVGAAASAVLGSGVDAMLMMGVIGLNAGFGGIQRLRGQESVAYLAAGQELPPGG